MAKVITAASMSLDGYIAGPAESGFDHLFAWYENGDVEVPTAKPEMTFHMDPASATVWHEQLAASGALIVGRRLFDLTNAWGGTHPLGVPVVVLTHNPPDDWPRGETPFTFVTSGIEEAVSTARDLAGGKSVSANGGTIARQCLDAGLLDEVWVQLVPVILGGGTPYFVQSTHAPYTFADPQVFPGKGVTHLRFEVRR